MCSYFFVPGLVPDSFLYSLQCSLLYSLLFSFPDSFPTRFCTRCCTRSGLVHVLTAVLVPVVPVLAPELAPTLVLAACSFPYSYFILYSYRSGTAFPTHCSGAASFVAVSHKGDWQCGWSILHRRRSSPAGPTDAVPVDRADSITTRMQAFLLRCVALLRCVENSGKFRASCAIKM